MESRASGEERPDLAPAMDRTAIPEQVDRSAQVAQEVTEEGLDIEAGEIVAPAPQIQCHPPALGRHRQPATDRQTVVAVPVTDARRLSLGRPGPAHIRDKQEPALIDEHEMGATSSGVFLSAASPPASTERSRPRRARPHAARASGNSSPTPSAPSRHALGDSARRTPGESIRSPAAASRDRFGTRRGARPGSTASRVAVSAKWIVAADVPGWVWRPVPASPSVGTPATSERPNSQRPRPDWRRPRDAGPTPTAEQRGDGASPVAWALREVA
jgi:hypothetical protein